MADAREIANRIMESCEGEPAAEVYAALSMVLGFAASLGKRPDFDGMMALVTKTARWEFDRRRAEIA